MSEPTRPPINAVTTPAGYRAGGVACGIKASGQPDLALLVSDRPAAAAAVFTRSQSKAEPLLVDQEQLRDPHIQAVIVNSGNANCATGAQGLADARTMLGLAAERAGCAVDLAFVSSTGIIGHFLPMDRVREGAAEVTLSAEGGGDFARAILTTDGFMKEALATFEAGGATYTLGGCAKGAGMIHPNLDGANMDGPHMGAPAGERHATMLAYLTTDADIEPGLLQERLQYAVDRSFNMISVDGDTSTSDTVLILANGAAGGTPLTAADRDGVAAFDAALRSVCESLAIDIARGGEGATKLLAITVQGAADRDAAVAVARTVSTSVLLKAALSKGDPNWGRVVMAAGNAGVPFDRAMLRVWLGDRLLYADGGSTGIAPADAAQAVAGDTVRIRIDLGQGDAEATAWGCDLTEEYVRFNADYVT
ncbi:MAG: bifunctional glutamate N-acetyltransferase/amino-acid acetyltransferase ArgJ [Chloroflexi bacterium]|nr:bifunctional glutamate N-acetyltransferase/amino-acid acetyltransferase ArgJ [Chloroflexota bacterium]